MKMMVENCSDNGKIQLNLYIASRLCFTQSLIPYCPDSG